MIQRIQSVFLLLAAVCAFLLFTFPFGTTDAPVPGNELYQDAEYNIMDSPALLALFCIAGGLAFISIFLFNNRKMQVIMGRIALIANVLGLILVIFYYINNSAGLEPGQDQENVIGFALPIAFLVFAILALRFIGKDDKLVKSMDRLR